MSLTPKEWKSFQHYKERRPPWIKLHRPLLDNADFQRLPVASRALAPMLWLIAAEYENGTITASPDDIAWRLRMSVEEFDAAIKPLIEKEFFLSDGVAIDPLAERERETRPEAETQVQEEKIDSVVETRAREPAKSLISPDAFRISGEVLEAMGLEPGDPISVGAPMTVQAWLNGGWPAEIIVLGVRKSMQNRKGDPPSTLKYFEKAIARTHAEMSRPLPVVEIREAETLTVTHGRTGRLQETQSLPSVARRLAETGIAFGERPTTPSICDIPSGTDVRLLPQGGSERPGDLRGGDGGGPKRISAGRD